MVWRKYRNWISFDQVKNLVPGRIIRSGGYTSTLAQGGKIKFFIPPGTPIVSHNSCQVHLSVVTAVSK